MRCNGFRRSTPLSSRLYWLYLIKTAFACMPMLGIAFETAPLPLLAGVCLIQLQKLIFTLNSYQKMPFTFVFQIVNAPILLTLVILTYLFTLIPVTPPLVKSLFSKENHVFCSCGEIQLKFSLFLRFVKKDSNPNRAFVAAANSRFQMGVTVMGFAEHSGLHVYLSF